ncbi:MAG: methylated-DNA--[protein]-cysteine S-methyltransferase [Chloroflexota bacterium]
MADAVARYAELDGPWGPVHIAATTRGVVAVEQLTPEPIFVEHLEARLGARIERDDASLAGVTAQIGAFLEGRPSDLGDIPVDLRDRPAWDQTVLAAVRGIPLGETRSYGEVATMIGRRGAARAVGGAVGRNPVGFIVPCHRVIAGDGTLGGYGADWWGDRESRLAIKRALLDLESGQVRGTGRIGYRPTTIGLRGSSDSS